MLQKNLTKITLIISKKEAFFAYNLFFNFMFYSANVFEIESN